LPLHPDEFGLQEVLPTLDLATVFVRDLDGTIRFWSAGCSRLYGWSVDEAVGKSAHALLETVFPVPLGEVEAALRAGREWKGDLRHRCRNGSLIVVEARQVPRVVAPGRPPLVMESVTDVTEYRRIAAEHEHLNASLEARIAEEIHSREAALDRLAQSEKLNALNELAGGLAHDINNVLQAVSGLGSLIGRRADDVETVKRLAGLVEEAVRRGSTVTRRLLSFTRRGDYKAEPVSIIGLLRPLLDTLDEARVEEIEIRVEVSSDLPLVLVDPAQLETALLNLVTNACDAMMVSGGLLAFSISVERILEAGSDVGLKPGDYVRVDVSDTGVGMDPGTLRRALDPFFTTKVRGEGTGLGLPMVKGFLEQSGGAFSISSSLGKGTVAKIWLPVATLTVASVNRAEATFATRSAVPLVLVVDDEELVRQVVADELRDGGFDVVEADGGEEALHIITTNPRVSVLVSDLAMPGMTGNVLIREAHRRRPGLPAILLTGYAGDAIPSGDREHDESYILLHKPITGAQLVGQVNGLLG
jgi:PAS domain S-box-containing protein